MEYLDAYMQRISLTLLTLSTASGISSESWNSWLSQLGSLTVSNSDYKAFSKITKMTVYVHIILTDIVT